MFLPIGYSATRRTFPSRSSAQEIDFNGNRGWIWDASDAPSRIEIEFPDGYVTVHLSDLDLADAALDALERLNDE